MTKSARVYQENLRELQLGRALWRPEPSPYEVRIGDVGYINSDSGSWHLLFNILDRERHEELEDGAHKHFEAVEDEDLRIQSIYFRRQLQSPVYLNKSIRETKIEMGGSCPKIIAFRARARYVGR
ncbi:hypothetical protein QCA50_013660 [Cerrena zonata]|uniref:Uncharacterized protein n=1 Tax=Cerrena zonata TaxID=2478898 RepID=A0AAW0FQQ7_9APHY